MHSFLGVPILVRGEAFGNLYLTEKIGAGEFTDADEHSIVVLAEFAGLAIDHARRYTGVREHGDELQQTVARLEATTQIARALAGQTDPAVVLELVAKRGRALVSARALLIELERGGRVGGGRRRWRSRGRDRRHAHRARRHGRGAGDAQSTRAAPRGAPQPSCASRSTGSVAWA